MHKTFSILVYLLLATLPATLAGQEAPPPSIKIDFKAISWDKTIKGLHFAGIEEKQGMFIPNGGKSKEYRYSGPQQLTFYRQSETAAGEIVRTPVGNVALNPKNRNPLFIFIPVKKSEKEQYRIIVLDDSTTRFPGGAYRVLNFTKNKLACTIDKEKGTVAPGKDLVLKPALPDRSYFDYVMLRELEGNWEPMYATRWKVDRRSRTMVIVIPYDNYEGFDFKVFTDVVPLPEQTS